MPWWSGAAVAVAVLAFVVQALRFRGHVNDDAYITFRYSRHLWMGLGPYFNPGEHVEGYTNFLLMLLLAPVGALLGPAAVPVAAQVTGVAAGAACVALAGWLAWDIARASGPPAWSGAAAPLAAGLVAAAPSFAVNSTSGLETSLFAAGLAAGIALAARARVSGRWCGAGIAFAAACLTRPEGPVLVAVHAIASVVTAPVDWRATARAGPAGLLREVRRAPLGHVVADVALVTAAVAGHTLLRYLLYDGEWLPNTYHAKAGGFWRLGAWDYVSAGAVVPLGGLVGVGFALAGWALPGPRARAALPVAVVAMTGAALPFVTGTDWMPGQRLVMPYLPLAAVIAAAGWCRLGRRILAPPAWATLALAVGAVAAVAVSQASQERALHAEIALRARGYREGHEELARWLCGAVTRPGDIIALMDIGIVGYRCIDRTILDITGLTDRFIARSPGLFLDKRYEPGYVLGRRPLVIVLVLWQPAGAAPTPGGIALSPWTRIEGAILSHPDFQRGYRRPPADRPAGRTALEEVARLTGAERVFDHAYPGGRYLLAAFVRQAGTHVSNDVQSWGKRSAPWVMLGSGR